MARMIPATISPDVKSPAERMIYSWLSDLEWNIVLCSTLLGMAVFFNYKLLSGFLFTGFPKEVLDFIFEVVFIADTSFVIVFVCRFVNWLIARPMSKAEIVLTFANGVAYLLVSVASALSDFVILNQIQAILPPVEPGLIS